MTRKKKILKCPECGSEDIEDSYHDCPTCNCGQIFQCNDCYMQFDKNGEEI